MKDLLLLVARVVVRTSKPNAKISRRHFARAARLFFLIQPIKSLICDVVVSAAVVIC